MYCHKTRRAPRLLCACNTELNLTSTLLPLFAQWHMIASIPIKHAIQCDVADFQDVSSGVLLRLLRLFMLSYFWLLTAGG